MHSKLRKRTVELRICRRNLKACSTAKIRARIRAPRPFRLRSYALRLRPEILIYIRCPSGNSACIGLRVSQRRCGAVVGAGLSLLLITASAFGQDLGHRLPGLLGLDAGRIPEPGLYAVSRLAIYQAEELRDRNGDVIPTAPFNLLGRANA